MRRIIIIVNALLTIAFFTIGVMGCKHIGSAIDTMETYLEAHPELSQKLQEGINFSAIAVGKKYPQYSQIVFVVQNLVEGLSKGTTRETISAELAKLITARINGEYDDQEVRQLLIAELSNGLLSAPASGSSDTLRADLILLEVSERLRNDRFADDWVILPE